MRSEPRHPSQQAMLQTDRITSSRDVSLNHVSTATIIHTGEEAECRTEGAGRLWVMTGIRLDEYHDDYNLFLYEGRSGRIDVGVKARNHQELFLQPLSTSGHQTQSGHVFLSSKVYAYNF